MVIAAALAVAQAGASLIGGLINSSQAKAQAEFNAKLYQEQANYYDYLATRKITQETATDLTNVTARGVDTSGTVSSRILSDNFDKQLQKQFEIANILRQATASEIQGSMNAQSQLVSGIGNALTGGVGVYSSLSDSLATSKAKKDMTKPKASANPIEVSTGIIKVNP